MPNILIKTLSKEELYGASVIGWIRLCTYFKTKYRELSYYKRNTILKTKTNLAITTTKCCLKQDSWSWHEIRIKMISSEMKTDTCIGELRVQQPSINIRTEYKSYYIFELVPNGKYLYMIPARYSISVDFIKKSIVAHHFLCKKTVTTLAQSFFHSWYFQMLLNNLVLLANSYSPSTCI